MAGSEHKLEQESDETYRDELKRLKQRVQELEQREEDLLVSRRRFEILARVSPVGIFRNDMQGNLTYGNERTRLVTGYDAQNLSRGKWPMTLHPDDRERVVDEWRLAIRHRRNFKSEYRFQRPDGCISWVICEAVPERDAKGEVVGYVGTLTDISDRKIIEETLNHRVNFQHLITSISTHFLNLGIDDLDKGINQALKAIGSFVDVDRAYVFQFTDNGLATCTHEWCMGSITPSIQHLQNMEVAKYPFSLGRIQGGEELCVPRVKDLGEDAEPTKSRLLEEGIQTILALPMISEGKVIGSLGFDWVREESFWTEETIDLLRIVGEMFANALTRAHAALTIRRGQEEFRAIFEGATDAVIIQDEAGKLLQFNDRACQLFDRTQDELLELTFSQLSFNGRNNARDWVEKASATHMPQLFEWQFVNPSGATWWAETHLNWTQIAGENRLVAMVRDISSRKRAEEERLRLEGQIQHSQKLESLGVLAGGIAHDFNNLLLAILGNADLSIMEVSKTSPAQAYLEDVVQTTRRAAELCNQLLAYSGKGKFVVQAIDLRELVKEMAQLLEVSISKKANLQYRFAKTLPAIQADVTQTRQIIMNLITNASDALDLKGGVITLTTGVMDCDQDYLSGSVLDDDLPEGQYVFMEVMDNGVGMDEETLNNIFDPFFSTKFTGRGLGLAAVLGIVRAHQGAIRVESQAGHGTSFRVLFPATNQKSVSDKEREREELKKGHGTILLADDEELILDLGKKILGRFGYQVLCAMDGQEAVDLYKAHGSDIRAVVLDLTMPRMSGEEALAELQKLNPDVRIILSSGYSETEISNTFKRSAPTCFIQKPYRPMALVKKLEEIL